jgi:DNA transformation protein
MKKNNEFHDYVLLDLLSGFSSVTSRAMFGGYGIYKEAKIFAIIVAGELFFKADQESKKYFKGYGSQPFTYKKKDDKTYTMNYWLVPSHVIEDREQFAEWVGMAIVA